MVDKGIPVRLVLYGIGLVYLVLDLFVFAGPLRRAVFRKRPDSPEVIAAAKREGVAARVYFQPILLTQVDRRVEEELWKEGRRVEDLTPQKRKGKRLEAVNDLVDLHLLRIKTRYNARENPVDEAAVEADWNRFVKRFSSEEEFQASLQRRGWSEQELRMRLAARLQQQMYLESMIEITVTEDEARIWFEENREALALPERLRARHVFLATLGRDSARARRILEDARQRIERGVLRFGEAARKLSEDERTKETGGDLGWLHKERVPADLAEPLFALPTGKLELIRTKIGWHLVEVLERKEARERTYAEAREDVLAALEAVKRDHGLRAYRKQLRELEGNRVEIFQDVLEEGLETAAPPEPAGPGAPDEA